MNYFPINCGARKKILFFNRRKEMHEMVRRAHGKPVNCDSFTHGIARQIAFHKISSPTTNCKLYRMNPLTKSEKQKAKNESIKSDKNQHIPNQGK